MQEVLEQIEALHEASRRGAGDQSLNQVTMFAVCVRESVCGYAYMH